MGLNTIRPYTVNTLSAILKRVGATCFLAIAATRLRRRIIFWSPRVYPMGTRLMQVAAAYGL